ncbi:MAG: NAD(P)-binding domain-containing protein [Colwellia sp.]|nr:NAD(P)-binding domain-containing protein [Colwellia sp.]
MTIKVITSVGIIGCGWLGNALASQLKEQGIKVLATRSNDKNVEQLLSQGIDASVLLLPSEQDQLNSHSIFNSQCIIIAITPQFKQGRADYGDKIEQLIIAAKASSFVEQIILLSSTAVYNGLSGNITETSALDFSADKVTVLNQAEKAVLSFSDTPSEQVQNLANKKSSYVLRLAGLVGPNRHPGKFLLNGRMLKSPEAKVNLIHQQDVIGLTLSILSKSIECGIFNGVSSTHVSKKEYYQAAAHALSLDPPCFEEVSAAQTDKENREARIIMGDKAETMLGYQFYYADLLNWLSQKT